MNTRNKKRLIGAICADLNLDGCYPHIMPNVTGVQLAKLLDAAEEGGNAEMWSDLVVQFLYHGNKSVIATATDRLIARITESYDAAWTLLHGRDLTDEHRTSLAKLVTCSEDAAWVLGKAIGLDRELQNVLVARVTTSDDAKDVLTQAHWLNCKQRDALVALVIDSDDAIWVLRNAPNLSDEQRKHLETMAEQ